jgi:hypothetical protein
MEEDTLKHLTVPKSENKYTSDNLVQIREFLK